LIVPVEYQSSTYSGTSVEDTRVNILGIVNNDLHFPEQIIYT